MIVHDLLHSKKQTELCECVGPLLTVEGCSSVEHASLQTSDGILRIHDASDYGRKGSVCRARSAAQVLGATLLAI
jgi:hypothetical protein